MPKLSSKSPADNQTLGRRSDFAPGLVQLSQAVDLVDDLTQRVRCALDDLDPYLEPGDGIVGRRLTAR